MTALQIYYVELESNHDPIDTVADSLSRLCALSIIEAGPPYDTIWALEEKGTNPKATFDLNALKQNIANGRLKTAITNIILLHRCQIIYQRNMKNLLDKFIMSQLDTTMLK
jgi:hypothetical protein